LSHSKARAVAFVEQLRPLQSMLEAYCRRMLRDRSLAEDVLQSAIVQAFAHFDGFTPGTNFKAWVFRFVTLEIFGQNRKRPLSFLGDFSGDDPVAAPLPDNVGETLLRNPEAVFDLLDEEVVEALQRLSPPERAVLLLRAIGEFSYHEIHELLSIPLGSVMGYLSRARSRLRSMLAAYAAREGLHPRDRAAGGPLP
jgi:RNA polymerase sigma-70 factor, ECF subfamily